MSPKVQILRSLVQQRLTAAAEEIFGLFERTIAEYEEELCRTKEENQRQRQILDCVWNPRVLIHKTDVQQLSVVKEEVPPEQQESNPIVDQEEPEPEPIHITEEQEELWTRQEAIITKFPSTPVPVKSENDDDGELNQTQTEENKVEANKVDCGGSEPSSSFHPHRHLQTKMDEQNEDSEETEDSDEDQTLNHKHESKLPTNSSTEQMETETDRDDGGGSEPDIILVHMESVKRRTFDNVQQLSVVKEEVRPEQQEWNPIVDQEEPEPETPHIKEEQEELWTSQEVNIIKFPSTPVPVKSEDDDEKKVKFSELNQRQTEENKEEANKLDCGGSEPSSSFHPHRHLRRKTVEQNEDSEETEDSDEDQTLNHKPESKLPTNSSTEQMETETDRDDSGGSEPDINLVHMESVKRRTFDSKSLLEEHMDTHTGQKLVGSSECEATFSQTKNTTQETNSPRDMMKKKYLSLSDLEWKNKLYHCSVCSKTFCWKSKFEVHMRIHTGEKPFCCSLCGSRFAQNSALSSHMMSHTGQKPFRCSICHKGFRGKSEVERHMRFHTGERPFSCSECSKRFTQRASLKNHMRLHTGERPFSCAVCQKRFTRKYHLQTHMKIHTRQ
ncbi:zinc finger protein 37-like isoform X5 [Sphaeramia orbicularis]|uniref:zinc finger protein 37-like isoform X5 n=1 Tax=Sphaeramia orbicularis TaxID=375764 RepID=UPI00117FE1D5|nr:zinc finger protein 37-like isoform X5 [Sphaeramia orbicularis]